MKEPSDVWTWPMNIRALKFLIGGVACQAQAPHILSGLRSNKRTALSSVRILFNWRNMLGNLHSTKKWGGIMRPIMNRGNGSIQPSNAVKGNNQNAWKKPETLLEIGALLLPLGTNRYLLPSITRPDPQAWQSTSSSDVEFIDPGVGENFGGGSNDAHNDNSILLLAQRCFPVVASFFLLSFLFSFHCLYLCCVNLATPCSGSAFPSILDIAGSQQANWTRQLFFSFRHICFLLPSQLTITMVAALRLSTSAFRATSRASFAKSTAFTAARCYSAKTQVCRWLST